jgi:hypothetical protein
MPNVKVQMTKLVHRSLMDEIPMTNAKLAPIFFVRVLTFGFCHLVLYSNRGLIIQDAKSQGFSIGLCGC